MSPARSSSRPSEGPSPFDKAGARVIQTPLQDEAEGSYLEYAYSVINSRALPDARDGLKPVHRRILFSMSESGLRPDHAYVKSARVVGDVMGRYHPHGDSAIYDAMVRLGQPFAVNTPLIDGHGNFGSPNDSPAAMRYTEARMSPFAMLMVGELSEDTVVMEDNYDGSLKEPTVMPAAYPFLLVNGTAGIAVGMATKMIPHNLGEIIAAARLLIKKPKATLEDLMELVPGPDLPTGGAILGLDQVSEAYATGKGTIRIRAKASIAPIEGARGRSAITITELPYEVGTERVIEAIKTEIGKKRLAGISDVKDLSDRVHGTRLMIECKAGINAEALLSELWRFTPLEVSFGIANLALVDGTPRMLGLKELLEVFLDHRYNVVTRRTEYRLRKAQERLHIVDGLLIALDNIDAVVKIIRGSKNTTEARAGLIKRFKLSDIQAGHILDMPLRRLVSLEVETLRKEAEALRKDIAHYEKILSDDKMLRGIVDKELAAIADEFGEPRKTVLVSGDLKEVLAASAPATPLEVSDDPCNILLSAAGLLARTTAPISSDAPEMKKATRQRHDAIIGVCAGTARGEFIVVTNKGRGLKVNAVELPAIAAEKGAFSLRGGMPAREYLPLQSDEIPVGVAPVPPPGSKEKALGIAMGTRLGVVKICAPDWPTRSNEFDIISLRPGDEVISAAWVEDPKDWLVFIANNGQLLRFPASSVRPQGRSGGGMAGIRLAAAETVVGFSCVSTSSAQDALVVTSTGVSAKVTPLAEYPAKGRGTGGVRVQRFLKGESALVLGWAGSQPVGCGSKGEPVSLPDTNIRRDASGTGIEGLVSVGSRIP